MRRSAGGRPASGTSAWSRAEMPVMAASHEAGEPVDVDAGSTVADGLAVRVAIPLAVSRLNTVVDDIVRVSERAIADALVVCHDARVLVEPRRRRRSPRRATATTARSSSS